ncbi:alpha/beta fold hydrolase [Nocardioides marmoribigeumensis]|uniref:Pimeloyl-ACP methyl ester carboxylesterase n=1 Tax=Nocardioides marmoribigeumensis TaxID=433649 RepID=A0ABU2BV23_9ACTN|nr:alpha/beta hydrolase [Nocardioides marmoribigeumensis]MDR7362484.1 pimeloyl-ACP methyl ester carboxylesterase [Nocardioides marmoribigeumensis]
MRTLAPDVSARNESDGVRIHHEVWGEVGSGRDRTVLLLPTWTIVHKRLWKAQVPYLSRHLRVLTYDGPGNGGSDRPLDPAAYDHDQQVRHAVRVLDASGTDRAVVVAFSQGCTWALELAAFHPERVRGVVLIGAAVPLTDGHAVRVAEGDPSGLPPSRVPLVEQDPDEHWAKYDPGYWREHHEDFCWFFFGRCFPEPHSTKQVEDCVGWALETTPEVLAAEALARRPSRELVEGWCRSLTAPVLALHGDEDLISPPSRGRRIAELTGGEYVELVGSGHVPQARDPVRVNLLVAEFAARCFAADG